MIEQLVEGNFVVRDDRQFLISEINGHKITLLDSFTDNKIVSTISELHDQILLGKTTITYADKKTQLLHNDSAMDFSSYPENLKKKAIERWAYVSAVKNDNIITMSERTLKPVIEKVHNETGIMPPSWRTLIRWCKRNEQAGVRGLLSGEHLKGNRQSRVSEEVDNMIISALENLKRAEKISYRRAYVSFSDAILMENVNRSKYEKLSGLSYQAFISRAKKIAPYELLVNQLGKNKADVIYRENKRNKPAKRILEKAEIDHTKLDLFVVDELHNFPLGRPYITTILDMKSKGALGFYVGFETPSYVSVVKAVKCAISDKSELLKDYPSVKNEWLCKGVFQELAYDRGKEFDSNLLEEALLDLNIVGRGNPRKKPWYKGSIESHFRTINKRLLEHQPGKVFTKITDSNDYQPEKNGVIGFRAFIELLLLWIVDEYQVGANSEGTSIPNLTWREDLKYVDVTPINPDKLDILLAENDTRINKVKGITKSYLTYDNAELVKLRKRHGFKTVNIKINRDDLGYIYVLNDVTRQYFKVPALDQEYANGLSMYQHKCIIRFHKKYISAQIDPLALAQTRKTINDIVLREMKTMKRFKSTGNARIARFSKVGEDNSVPATLIPDNMESEIPAPENIRDRIVEENLKQFDNIEDDLDDEMDA